MAEFDLEELKEFCTEMTFARGKRLQEDGGVMHLWLSETNGTYRWSPRRIELYGMVRGTGMPYYHVKAHLDTQTGGYEDARCDCPAYRDYDGLCKHCVAMFLEYFENQSSYLNQLFGYVPSWARGGRSYTDRGMAELLRRRGEKERLLLTDHALEGRVRLEPTLLIEHGDTGVSFRIGTEPKRMYVVKDIMALVDRVRSSEDYAYGKNLSFVHTPEAFEEKSRRLIELFLRHYDSDYSRYGSAIRYLGIDGELLDGLLEIMGRDGIAVMIEGKEAETYTLTDTKLMQAVTIRGEERGAVLSYRMKRRFLSNRYVYYLKDHLIYRRSRSETQELEELEDYLYQSSVRKPFIAEEDLPLFVRELYPVMNRFYDVRTKGIDLKRYLPAEASFQTYFDLPQDDLVTCDLIAVYGENVYHVFEGISDENGRNVRQESAAHALIMSWCNAFDQARFYAVCQGEDAIYTLITDGFTAIAQRAEIYVSDRMKKISRPVQAQVSVGISLSGDLLQLSVSSDTLPMDELAALLSKYDRKKKYVRLKNGAFLPTDDAAIDTLAQAQKGLMLPAKELAKGEVTVPKFRTLFLDAMLRDNESVTVEKNADFRRLVRNMRTIEESEFEVPASLSGVLREYQKYGCRWMETLYTNGFSGILADDMGLGKTLQVIAFLLAHYEAADARSGLMDDGQQMVGGAVSGGGETAEPMRTLIVAPASLVYNWEQECRRFAPSLPVMTVAGTAAERQAVIAALPERIVVITSYDLLKRDLESYQKYSFFCQVIDEAQFIKNSTTKAAQSVKRIQSGFRLALTGTPMENRLSELWSIFDFLMPGYLFSYQRYRAQFEAPIAQGGDEKALENLRKMITPFMLRRLKKDVLKDLPEKIEKNMAAQMTGEQRKLYDAHVQRLQIFLDRQDQQSFDKSKIQILAELTKLRQLCCDPGLLYENYAGGSTKLQLCLELVQSAVSAGHKILLFSQFTSMLDRIADLLEREKISFYMLTGSTPKLSRSEMTSSFQEDDVPVFLISLKAGGTGLNLTAADIVIHFDPWWNTAAQNQATDRTHRIGQKNTVMVYRLIAADSIEENIVRLQERKQELADQILSGSGAALSSFSREEIEELLGVRE